MADPAVTEEQMSLLLQAASDFALAQMARGERLVPFAAVVRPDGEIAFVRFAEADTVMPLADVLAGTQARVAAEAAAGEVVAAALASSVAIAGGGDYREAIALHLEAPGFCRRVLAPYTLRRAPDAPDRPVLARGDFVPLAADPVLFAR